MIVLALLPYDSPKPQDRASRRAVIVKHAQQVIGQQLVENIEDAWDETRYHEQDFAAKA